MRPTRTLRSRLFVWFVGAILLAILTSSLVGLSTRPEAVTGVEAMARNVAARLASSWDDPAAREAYVSEVRDVTGFDTRLVLDARKLPPRVHAAARRGAAIVPQNPQHVFIPVVRDGRLAGALEMERLGVRAAAWPWWRFVLALVLVGAVLSVMAGRVANLLSRPLEQLADAADRFGGGELSFRAGPGQAHRWVALEVRELAVAFDRMAGRVEAMVKGQRELLGAISHEVRSPLGRARVALEITRDRLQGPAGDRPPEASLDEVEKQLGAIDALLGDLLDVTRAGLADLRRETTPVVPWLRERAAEEPTPPAILVEADPAAEDATLAFDRVLLGRAVHNLLLNARAHGHPPDRPLRLAVSRDAGSLRVQVRDEGPGFAPGFSERAFEPFARGESARSRPAEGAGHGLGLTIVRRVVEAHGGRVFAKNAPERPGAIVGFELPMAHGAG